MFTKEARLIVVLAVIAGAALCAQAQTTAYAETYTSLFKASSTDD